MRGRKTPRGRYLVRMQLAVRRPTLDKAEHEHCPAAQSSRPGSAQRDQKDGRQPTNPSGEGEGEGEMRRIHFD